MKYLVLMLFLVLAPTAAMAASQEAAPQLPPDFLNLPDFLSNDTVPLTQREKKALNLTRAWAGRGPAPVLSHSGKLVYVHGASLPTILASPMQVCDVELQPGEKVNEVIVGDSAQQIAAKKAAQERETSRNTAMLDGKSVDISKLNFNFDVRGKASWKPERVFDDGEKIYIHLPRKTTELPVLLARRKGENVLVNYRADGKKLVVDGIFDELTLLLGVGSGKEEIRIIRKS